MRDYDVICLGDAKIDEFLSLETAADTWHLDQTSHELCFKHGEKVEVDKCTFCLGGNAANVAVGLSRQGFKTGLVAEIGDDELSQKILNILSQEQVDSALLKQTKFAAVSLSVIISVAAERTIFSEHVERQHDFRLQGLPKFFYLTSLGKEWKPAYQKMLDYVTQNAIDLVFNPGTLQIEQGEEVIRQMLAMTKFLFINKQEAEKIAFGKEKPADIKELMTKLQQLGAKTVVITDGENGSFALDTAGKAYYAAVVKEKIVEKTGAGDAFASGFLGAVLSGLGVEQAMRWGSQNAAAVIKQIGATAGLLTKQQLFALTS